MALLNVIKSICSRISGGFPNVVFLPSLFWPIWVWENVLPMKDGSQIRVVASIPDLADLAARIGGDLVSVESLAKGVEDPHGVPIKPSFVPKLNRADALVVLGLQAHHAWLPALIDVAQKLLDPSWQLWLYRLFGEY